MLKNEINVYNDGIKCRRLYIVFSWMDFYIFAWVLFSQPTPWVLSSGRFFSPSSSRYCSRSDTILYCEVSLASWTNIYSFVRWYSWYSNNYSVLLELKIVSYGINLSQSILKSSLKCPVTLKNYENKFICTGMSMPRILLTWILSNSPPWTYPGWCLDQHNRAEQQKKDVLSSPWCLLP